MISKDTILNKWAYRKLPPPGEIPEKIPKIIMCPYAHLVKHEKYKLDVSTALELPSKQDLIALGRLPEAEIRCPECQYKFTYTPINVKMIDSVRRYIQIENSNEVKTAPLL